jgi:hypothetical protein
LIGDAPWIRHSEKAFFHAIDHNYFATQFHINMFEKNLFAEEVDKSKIIHSGWPMEYLKDILEPFKGMPKRDLILFPHRIAPEKQVEIFRDLAASMPEYEWIVCQDQQLSKLQYHTLLGSAKIVWSANLQETLGISCYEGALVDAVPLVPDRLSYSEMYTGILKYPSVYTESWDSYLAHKSEVTDMIIYHMEYYERTLSLVRANAESLTKDFFSATKLLENIK